MVELNYGSGRIISEDVHDVGILVIGSHLENHGAALPIDTDSKIASYVGLEASIHTGARFLGVLYAATEFSYVKHGVHFSKSELLDDHLRPTLINAKKYLDVDKVVIVNGHGGNNCLEKEVEDLKKELDMEIVFNNTIIDLEDGHAASGELSIGIIVGIVDEGKLREHSDIDKYPEVGMIGLDEARKKNKEIDDCAKIVEKDGIVIDPVAGQNMLDKAIRSVEKDVKNLVEYDDYY